MTDVADNRLTWPETWMTVATTIAGSRSLDPRLKVCALIVPEDNTGILALGYNGGARGLYNVPVSLEPGKSQFIHAEANALIKCPYHFPKKKHMYVTHSPCLDCARLIVNADVSRVVYKELYRDEAGLKLLRDAGVEVHTLPDAIAMARAR